ncbi:MAG: PGPGW domain-containing protein [Alphaproteobacteria bacterium]
MSAASPQSPPPAPRKRNWAVYILGWTFLVLGALGLFLPFLQGVLFLAIGLVLLSREVKWARELRARLLARFPGIKAKIRRAEAHARAMAARRRRRRAG